MTAEIKVEPPGSVASMVCGIISIVLACLPVVPLVLGIIAINLANKGKVAITESPDQFKPVGIRTAGFVCGIIGTSIGALYSLYWVIFILTMGGSAAHLFRGF